MRELPIKLTIPFIAPLLVSFDLTAETYATVAGDYSRSSAKDVEEFKFDGWGTGVDLTHWFDNETYINDAIGINESSIDECLHNISIKADTDAILTYLAVGSRFKNITPFVKGGYTNIKSTYAELDESFTDNERERDIRIGGLVQVCDVIWGLSADGFRDTRDGFTVNPEMTYKVTNSDGLFVEIGRLLNVDDIEWTRFGIVWTRFS